MMLSFLRPAFLLLLLGLPVTATLTSCSDKKTDTPAPTTGSIEGVVSPAAALTKVTATDGGGLEFPATPNVTTGKFTIADLVPGSYQLSFTPANGYRYPNTRTVSVTAGQTTSAGTVNVQGDGSIHGGTMTWTANGNAYTATSISGTVNGALSLTGTAVNGTSSNTVSFYLARCNAGTQQLGVGYDYTGGYDQTTNGLPTGSYYCGGLSSPQGTLTLTTLDYNAGTASGSFGFTAYGASGTSGTAVVTNGTFNLRF